MNLVQLKRRFVYEAKANPKKVMILGGLLLVGSYFWGPLAMKLVSKKGPTTAAKTAPVTTLATETTAAAPTAEPQLPWQDVAQWIAKSSGTQPPAELPQFERNPFARPAIVQEPEPEVKPVDEPPEEQAKPPAKPSTDGLVLSTTVVGPRRRTAIINGRVYLEGKRLRHAGTDFVIQAIRPGRVILEFEGTEYPLVLPAPDMAGMVTDDNDSN